MVPQRTKPATPLFEYPDPPLRAVTITPAAFARPFADRFDDALARLGRRPAPQPGGGDGRPKGISGLDTAAGIDFIRGISPRLRFNLVRVMAEATGVE